MAKRAQPRPHWMTPAKSLAYQRVQRAEEKLRRLGVKLPADDRRKLTPDQQRAVLAWSRAIAQAEELERR